MTEQLIPRIKITGTLTNLSKLMIGSGQEIAKTVTGKDITSPTHTAICLADGGKPYIPASSLRGLLLSLCNAGYGKDSTISKTLFGSAKINPETEAKKGNDTDGGNMGALRIYDAICPTSIDVQKPDIRTRNAVNPITGTAEDKKLYSHAYVPEGSQFTCEIEADNLNEIQITHLLGLLAQLDATPYSQLGKGKSNQQGLIKWQLEKQKIQILSSEKLLAWLSDSKANTAPVFTNQGFDAAQPPTAKPAPSHSFKLTITPQSPILINDPERVKPDKGTGEAKLEFYRNPQGQLVIPASSLKGVMRSQCRKILLTIIIDKAGLKPQDNHSAANATADQLIGELFGGTQQQSLIWLTDAVAENSSPHTQTFNAVDRFTGGVAEGALYTANAATAKEITTGLYLKKSLADWQKGLLILVLRDAMEGDLAVGWGKAKGFGSITIAIDQLPTWQAVIDHFSHEKLTTWLEKFAAKIAQTQPEPKP